MPGFRKYGHILGSLGYVLNSDIPYKVKHLLHLLFDEVHPATAMTFRFIQSVFSTEVSPNSMVNGDIVLNPADYVHTNMHITMLRHYNISQAHTPLRCAAY